MSDNKTKTGTQDRIRIDANDPNEVEYVHDQFPDFTHAEIIEAIKISGPLRTDVIRYLSTLNDKDKAGS